MIKVEKTIELKDEYYDITKYIGIVDSREQILESYLVRDGYIVLTNKKLMNIEERKVIWELNLDNIDSFSLKLEERFNLTLVEKGKKIDLIFEERVKTLHFYKNIVSKIA